MSSKGIEFLLPIKPYLASFNTILTVLLNVAPITKFINISRGKEPYTNIPFLMLIINIVNNIVWSCYWIKLDEFISFLSSFISGFFSTAYILWYNYFASNNNKYKFVIYILIQVVCEVFSTLFFLSDILKLQVVGLIMIVITIFQYVAPAQNVVKAFKEKNDKLIPIVSTLCGCLSGGGWFFFGLIIMDFNCMIPNGLGFLSSILTVCAWMYIKNTKKKEDDEGEEMGETLNEEEK